MEPHISQYGIGLTTSKLSNRMINTQGVQEVRLKDVLHPQYLRNVELLSSPLPCVCQVILL